MAESYPYIISNNKIEPILTKIRSAARPERFNRQLLSKMGFTASNDRAMINVLKELGFLNEAGAPTEAYDRLRHPSDWKYVLAEKIRELYAELYAIDESIHSAPDPEIRGALSRVTGKDDKTVGRYLSTFKTLASLAKFNGKASKSVVTSESVEPAPVEPRTEEPQERSDRRGPPLFYNIQIHLPATTDISVYNAIFRSLRDNLII